MIKNFLKKLELPNPNLLVDKFISQKFLSLDCTSFYEAIQFVHHLPYGRTSKADCLLVLAEMWGTCSTKHSLIAELARELNIRSIQLYAGIFTMSAINTPKIANILKEHGLDGIPEAHCYLEFNQNSFDITFSNNKQAIMTYHLVEKIKITPEQISDFKVNWHRKFIKKWLSSMNYSYTVDELWSIRESCIAKISSAE